MLNHRGWGSYKPKRLLSFATRHWYKVGTMKLSLAPLVADRLQLPVLMALQSFNLTIDRSPR